MNRLKVLFLAILILFSLRSYSQGEDTVLPETNPESEQETEWTVLHLHNTEKLYDGVSKVFKNTTVDENKASFPSDNDIFAVKFDRYLKRNKEELNKKKIVLLRFLMDKDNNFSSEQKKILSETAEKNGFKIRFETVKIDWDARRRKLAESADRIIDNSISEDIKNKNDISIEIKKTKKGFRKFWNDIYETPTRSEVYGGVTKGVITMALTMGAWSAMGMNSAQTVFWVLTAEHILQEIFFGPYIKTYVNFLYKKVKAKAGDLGVTLWGNVQGFVLFSFDKFLIYTANMGTAPWDPTYLASYFGMATVGSLLGGFMPIGVFKLIQKGYINRSTGMVSMQALDLVMPLEGALLAFDSPYLIWVFSIHQLLKFGVYVAGVSLEQKGSLIMVPSELYDTEEAKAYLNLDSIASSNIFKTAEKTLEFLKDESIPMGLKVNFLKYIDKVIKTDVELINNNEKFKEILKDILTVTSNFLVEEGQKLQSEINENNKKTGFKALFTNQEGDVELGYNFKSLSHFWETANQVKKNTTYVNSLKKKMKMLDKMDQILSGMPLNDYGIDLPIRDLTLGADLGVVGGKFDKSKSGDVLFGTRLLSDSEALMLLSNKTGSLTMDLDFQIEELMKIWAERDGVLGVGDMVLCFGHGDGYSEEGIYEYVLRKYFDGKYDSGKWFLVLSGALFAYSSEVGELTLLKSSIPAIRSVYEFSGLLNTSFYSYMAKSASENLKMFEGSQVYMERFNKGYELVRSVKK